MQVKDLQPFLADLGRFLESSGGGKTVARDFEQLSEGLSPFAEMKISQLCDFLKQAEEYQRTGIVTSGKKSGRGSKKLNEQEVKEWAQKMSKLREDAISEDVTYSQIDAEVGKMAKANTKPVLDAIAKELGLSGSFKKKADTQKAIQRLIAERKESHQRTSFGSVFSGR